MDFTELLIKEYAKKIYGFAYSKTNNYHNAEDLSQEIIIALCDKTIAEKGIENMDAYIYRICFYTWSKYLNKNKPQWEALNNTTALDLIESDDNVEESYIQRELHEKLRQEIMYLSKTKRDITVMFYYENKSGNEISKLLNIPASTVRWYLSQTKIDLKERIEMTEQSSIYKPITMRVGHNGNVVRSDMYGLSYDALTQNICYVCYKEALTIEEIARKLSVAAIYLESRIAIMVYMDYMKKVGNKYRTTFYIPDAEHELIGIKYTYDNAYPYSLQIYNSVNDVFDDIIKLEFTGSKTDKNFLLWAILPFFLSRYGDRTYFNARAHLNAIDVFPKRADGSQHFVGANLNHENDIFDKQPAELRSFFKEADGNGEKTRGQTGIKSLQYDISYVGGWREFNTEELLQLKRIREININGEAPNEYDKEIISRMTGSGYVSVENGKPNLLIPYLSKQEMETMIKTVDKSAEKHIDFIAFEKYFTDYAIIKDKLFPDFLSESERNHHKFKCGIDYAALWFYIKDGKLKKPTADEKKRLCTIVWED